MLLAAREALSLLQTRLRCSPSASRPRSQATPGRECGALPRPLARRIRGKHVHRFTSREPLRDALSTARSACRRAARHDTVPGDARCGSDAVVHAPHARRDRGRARPPRCGPLDTSAAAPRPDGDGASQARRGARSPGAQDDPGARRSQPLGRRRRKIRSRGGRAAAHWRPGDEALQFVIYRDNGA